MKESVAIAKEADTKKFFSSTKSDNSIHRVRDEPERQLGSLRGVIGNIRRDDGTPSVESIATELSGMSAGGRAPVLLALQQTHGNQYVQRVVAGIQAKLKVGQPRDEYEQEADRVAEQVMRMSEPQVERQVEEEEEEEELIQTKPPTEEITSLVQRQVEEDEEELQAKVISGKTPEVSDNLQVRFNQSKGDGQPLPETLRAFFEPRFGHDFSQVQVHTDARTAALARSINARAFTVGRDVAFGAGQYAPETVEGKRLLAHELTHVVQQGHGTAIPHRSLAIGQANDTQESKANQVADFVTASSGRIPIGFTPAQLSVQRACGPAEIGRVGGCTGLTGDVAGERFLFVVNCDDFRPGEADRLRTFAATLEPDDILEIHGFASDEGTADFNENLSCARAHKAQSVLTSAGASIAQIQILNKHGATPGPRAERRSVVITKSQATPAPAPTPHRDPCAPSALPARATSFAQYVVLVRCAERVFPGYTPRQMLSLLRQIYYGHASWSRTRTMFWRDVIPCGMSIPDPRATLRTTLFNALRNSQESTGTDIGHVFTGWEAMLCPTPSVELEVFGPNPVVNMPNEEFATWGGDIGSAAAQKVYDEEDQGIRRSWPHYFGPGGTRVNYADLQGDIDSYVIRKGLTGAACAATPRSRITTISSPVSQILHQYYTAAATPVGRARINRFLCFAQAVGGTVSGGRITNKSSLINPILIRVESFARTFYLGLVTVPLFAIGVREALKLYLYSRQATVRFLNWLESRL